MLEVAIKAVSDMIASFFDWRAVAVENQETSEIIKDKQDLVEACNCAERAIEIVEREAIFRKKKHLRRFRSCVRRFRDLK